MVKVRTVEKKKNKKKKKKQKKKKKTGPSTNNNIRPQAEIFLQAIIISALFYIVGKRYAPQREKTYLLTCAPKEASDQPAHQHSLIRVFVVRVRKLWIIAIQIAPSEDSDQTARMRSLIWIFAGRTCPKYVFWRWDSYCFLFCWCIFQSGILANTYFVLEILKCSWM